MQEFLLNIHNNTHINEFLTITKDRHKFSIIKTSKKSFQLDYFWHFLDDALLCSFNVSISLSFSCSNLGIMLVLIA